MYLAKPHIHNYMNSQEFETIREAKLFLDEFTGVKMPKDEWIVLGKILAIDEDSKKYVTIDVDMDSFT